jgi:hypothetical protein
MTTDTLVADLRSYLTEEPKGPAAQGAPASAAQPATPTPPAPPAGQEPSPEGTQPGTSDPTEPILEDPDADGNQPPQGWPESALSTVTKLRAAKRELKKQLESERDAERQRAETLAAELAKLKAGTPAEGADGSNRLETAAPTRRAAGDRFDSIPEIRTAREQEAQHQRNYEFASALLPVMDTNPDQVLGQLKAAGLDMTGSGPEQVKQVLDRIKADSLVKHAQAAAVTQSLVRDAERAFGSVLARNTATAHTLLPELREPNSAEAKEAQKALARFPWLQDDPTRDLVVAALIEGNKVLQNRARQMAAKPAAAATAPGTSTSTIPAPAALPAAQLPGAPASLPPSTPAPNNVDALREKFFKSGRAEDREAWIRAQLQVSSVG